MHGCHSLSCSAANIWYLSASIPPFAIIPTGSSLLPDPTKTYTTQELMDYAPWTVNVGGKYSVSKAAGWCMAQHFLHNPAKATDTSKSFGDCWHQRWIQTDRANCRLLQYHNGWEWMMANQGIAAGNLEDATQDAVCQSNCRSRNEGHRPF